MQVRLRLEPTVNTEASPVSPLDVISLRLGATNTDINLSGGQAEDHHTEHQDLHHDVLLGEGLHGADVGPGVGHVDGVDDEDPVVGRLVEDGVSAISTEGEVANSQEVQ